MTSPTRLAPAHPDLAAHTERASDIDRLTDAFGTDGTAWIDGTRGFVTAGIAAVVEPEHAVAALQAIEHVGGGAPREVGPRAMGALPFAGGGRMVIPAHIVTRDADGGFWRTTIGSSAPPPSRVVGTAGPTHFSIDQRTTFEEWGANVTAALALIESGTAEKIVLAREIVVESDAPFDLRSLLETLHATQPGCVVYADNGFVGASPELLVRRSDNAVTARPMAGTGLDADALVRSEKDAREHQLVIDAVRDALMPACSDFVTNGPAPVGLTDLTHLATTITARLRDPETSAVDLALALHPTPAVAGTPRPAALAAIRRLEPTPRDRYAGPCGWVDAEGNGEFVVALRGAQIEGASARLHAGAGIVAGSDPAAEWAETQVKLEPMLRALIRV